MSSLVSCMSILSIVRTMMDFPSPCAKAAFVICFTLAFESTSFERKTMKYFVSAFYQRFMPPVKIVRSFNIGWR